MDNKLFLTHADTVARAKAVADAHLAYDASMETRRLLKVYPIPRGGVPAAYLLCSVLSKVHHRVMLTNVPEEADFFMDDIIDSGATRNRFAQSHPGRPFYALVDQGQEEAPQWVVFPWEQAETSSPETAEDNIRRILQMVGEDSTREGLLETPRRVVKAWGHWCSGYGKKPAEVLKVFEDGSDNYDQMVCVRNIPIYSHCEHHLAPFFGTATIAYIPNGKIVGLSKLSRLADIFARRLQVQERLTTQIADALQDALGPKGVGVLIRCRHMCMESRGVSQQGSETVTTALRGAMLDQEQVRLEFLQAANG